MLNFYVGLAGHDMVADSGRAKLCTHKFKGPSLSTKGTKNEGHLEKMNFSNKTFEGFNEKKYTSSLDQTTPWNTQPLKTTIEYGPCKQ